MAAPVASADLTQRLGELIPRGEALEAEGLPFPTRQIADSVRQAVALGDLPLAEDVLTRGEALYWKVYRDWGWVRALLTRADELRAIGDSIGVDLAHLDARVGNPRAQLRNSPISAGALERAAASASLAVAVLTDAIPKFCAQEAARLGLAIRAARDRGEDVTEATVAFARFLPAMRQVEIPMAAQQLLEVRKAVSRIPRAPAVGTLPQSEEEDILLEARNLARRLHKLKSRARDAHSAARLMADVRAALSEDRRYGTPEEEIEELWNEVDRLTKERSTYSPDFSSPLIPEEAAPIETPAPNARNRNARAKP